MSLKKYATLIALVVALSGHESLPAESSENTKAATQPLGSETDRALAQDSAVRKRQIEATDKHEASPSETLQENGAFASPQALNQAFIASNGAVNGESISMFFQFEDFDEVVNKVRAAGHDSQSSEREALLSQALADTFGSGVFATNHACSGQICTLRFQSINDVSQKQLTQLSSFDKKKMFTNTDVNDLGETTVRAIYIATDDPGSLVISP